jgi:FAD:protein FMN transferase
MKSVIVHTAYIMLLIACNQKDAGTVKISGEAQGTTYHITYLSVQHVNLKREIDSLLNRIDFSLSTYNPSSIISRMNKNDTTVLADQYFVDVFKKSLEISRNTDGLFDVTVGPLMNAWGFGSRKKSFIDSATIDSLLLITGYKMVTLEGNKLVKKKPQLILDFNAIAQGYSVDVLTDFLQSKGINNYLVELGGEVKAKGKKKDNKFWTIGIDQPNEIFDEERPLQAVITLNNKALATSGNYRKFVEENGQKYSHIMNPKTGYPSKQHLLSATVVADDAMTADAYATAFMVMGLEKSREFLAGNKNLELEAYFIYDEKGNWKTYISEGLRGSMKELPLD